MVKDFPVVEQTFQFRCTQCAECCTGEQTVLLNLYDLYKLAKYLKLQDTGQLFEQGWLFLSTDEENEVYRPQIRFKTFPFKFCPFLTNEVTEVGGIKGWCQLHPGAKPLICALSPIGIRYETQNDHLEFLLVPPTQNCPGLKEPFTQKLSSYLAPYQYEIELQKDYFQILEICKMKNWSVDDFKEKLYSFEVSRPFEEILNIFKSKWLC